MVKEKRKITDDDDDDEDDEDEDDEEDGIGSELFGAVKGELKSEAFQGVREGTRSAIMKSKQAVIKGGKKLKKTSKKSKQKGLEESKESDGIIAEQILGKDYEEDEKVAIGEYENLKLDFGEIPEIAELFKRMAIDEKIHLKNITDIECVVKRINREFGEKVITSIEDLVEVYKNEPEKFKEILYACHMKKLNL